MYNMPLTRKRPLYYGSPYEKKQLHKSILHYEVHMPFDFIDLKETVLIFTKKDPID